MSKSKFIFMVLILFTSQSVFAFDVYNNSSSNSLQSIDYSSLFDNSPELKIEMDQIIFTATSDILAMPYDMILVEFHEQLDSFTTNDLSLLISNFILVNGDIITSTDAEFTNYINQVFVESTLLDKFKATNTIEVYRRIPSDPNDAIVFETPEYDYGFDFSVYYSMVFEPNCDLEALAIDLSTEQTISKVGFQSKIVDLDVAPPDPPIIPDYCVNLQPEYLEFQKALLTRTAENGSGLGMIDAWRWSCSDFGILSGTDEITIGILDRRFGTSFHPDLNVDEDQSKVNFPLEEITTDPLQTKLHGIQVAGISSAKAYMNPDVGIPIGDNFNQDNKSVAGHSLSISSGPFLNDNKIVGGAPQCKIVVVDRDDGDPILPPSSSSAEFLSDLKYLIDETDVRVINFSFGYFGTDHDAAFKELLIYAHYVKGIALVAASGNSMLQIPSELEEQFLPASQKFLLTVGSASPDGSRTPTSAYGNPVDVVAPGTSVLTLYETNYNSDFFCGVEHDGAPTEVPCGDKPRFNYAGVGTSFSAPILTSLVANIFTVNPDLCATTAFDLIKESCYDNPNMIYDQEIGYGVPDAEKVILKAMNYGTSNANIAGDVNKDGRVNDGDFTMFYNYFYNNVPLTNQFAADVNGDCIFNLTDFIYFTNYIFNGGPDPIKCKLDEPILIPLLLGKNTDIPDKFEISQNYPNPFNPTTDISFSVPNASHVVIKIYNINGQVVETLVDKHHEVGNYTVQWDATNFSSGIYLYKIEAGDFIETKKMTLIK